MKEIWKAIPNYNGIYEASNLGRIRSVDRKRYDKNGLLKKYYGRIIEQTEMNAGYLTVGLSIDGVVKTLLTHRLIASTFINNPENFAEVNHIDGNKQNNVVSNLEWMSRNRNIRHAIQNGLIQGLGSQNPSAKLSDDDVISILELSRLNIHPKEVANALNIKTSTISDITSRRTWQHINVTGQWSEIRKDRGIVTKITYEIL